MSQPVIFFSLNEEEQHRSTFFSQKLLFGYSPDRFAFPLSPQAEEAIVTVLRTSRACIRRERKDSKEENKREETFQCSACNANSHLEPRRIRCYVKKNLPISSITRSDRIDFFYRLRRATF